MINHYVAISLKNNHSGIYYNSRKIFKEKIHHYQIFYIDVTKYYFINYVKIYYIDLKILYVDNR